MQWLRDQLGFYKNVAETEALIKGTRDTNGVYIVPAFTGLGAPFWDSGARGLICGLTRGASRAHIVRAALESIAYQTRDVADVMRQDLHGGLKTLKVDGGACRNNFLMQFQADMLGCSIVRPKVIDSTVFGTALLAGVTIGLWPSKKSLQLQQRPDKTFHPRMPKSTVNEKYSGWQQAVRKAQSS